MAAKLLHIMTPHASLGLFHPFLLNRQSHSCLKFNDAPSYLSPTTSQQQFPPPTASSISFDKLSDYRKYPNLQRSAVNACMVAWPSIIGAESSRSCFAHYKSEEGAIVPQMQLAFSWWTVLWDAARCLQRLARKAGVLSGKESVITEVEEKVDQAAEFVKKTAKSIDQAAKEVEKVAEMVEEGAEDVEAMVDKVEKKREATTSKDAKANKSKGTMKDNVQQVSASPPISNWALTRLQLLSPFLDMGRWTMLEFLVWHMHLLSNRHLLHYQLL